MTDTPVPDVREIAEDAIRKTINDRGDPDQWLSFGLRSRAADAVLAAVEPVIRRQVAEEIGEAITAKSTAAYNGEFGYNDWDTGLVREGLDDAAAIARSHSTQPGEETNG